MKIKNFHPHIVTGEIDNSFVGLKIVGNDIHFYYPEAYHFEFTDENTDLRHDILDLLKTISIAKTHSKDSCSVYNIHNNYNNFALYSYLWIIRDWLYNGFYINREKKYKFNQNGKINWKKTLNQQPIVSNGNIVFNNIVVEVKDTVDGVMLDIHKYCVKKSLEYIGWLFNINSKVIGTVSFNENIKKQYTRALKVELDRTFDDVKKLRLNQMMNIIVGLDTSNDSENFIYGVDSYHYIFERMIDSVFGTVKDLKLFNPKASWRLVKNGYKEKEASSLRPDTILIKDDVAYILDAKFYRFGVTGDERHLPETAAIQKQITYGDYLKKINSSKKDDNVKKIFNAFIIPYDSKKNNFGFDKILEYIGYAKTEWKDNKNEHNYVYSFLIDLKHVVHTWNSINHTDDIDILIKEISNANKSNPDMFEER